MNTVDILEEVKVLKVIRHICREVSRGRNQSATTSSQRNDEADGYWNHG